MSEQLDQVQAEATAAATGEASPAATVETEAERKARDARELEDQDKKEAAEWAGFPFVFGAIVARALPELAEVYSETACLEWGKKMAPIARRYGWTAGVAGAWFGLIGASWGMIEPTYKAAKAHRAKMRAAAPAPAPAAGSAAAGVKDQAPGGEAKPSAA